MSQSSLLSTHHSSLIIHHYFLHRFEQIFGDDVGPFLPRAALMFEFAATVARQHEGRADSGVARKLRVAVTVADHPAAREVEVEILRGAKNQTGPRLAAVAVEAIRRLADRRVVRAVVNRVEPRASALQLGSQHIVNFADERLFKIAARDARLVRDEDREPARTFERPHGLRREREDAVARDVVDVADLLRDRPVAVNEDRAPRAAHRFTSAMPETFSAPAAIMSVRLNSLTARPPTCLARRATRRVLRVRARHV